MPWTDRTCSQRSACGRCLQCRATHLFAWMYANCWRRLQPSRVTPSTHPYGRDRQPAPHARSAGRRCAEFGDKTPKGMEPIHTPGPKGLGTSNAPGPQGPQRLSTLGPKGRGSAPSPAPAPNPFRTDLGRRSRAVAGPAVAVGVVGAGISGSVALVRSRRDATASLSA